MRLHEDYGDEPGIEERYPSDQSPDEYDLAGTAGTFEPCELCGTFCITTDLIATDLWEYVTMDIDPGTKLCSGCYQESLDRSTPDDPTLYDAYTPICHC